MFLRRAVLAPFVGTAFPCYLWLPTVLELESLKASPGCCPTFRYPHIYWSHWVLCKRNIFILFYSPSQSFFKNLYSWTKDREENSVILGHKTLLFLIETACKVLG